MSSENETLIMKMISYDQGMAKQIQHFLKVYEFAHVIGISEDLDTKTQKTLETAAIVHDIGIKKALEKYNSSAGKYQEELGPDEARPMLKELGYADAMVDRVCYLVGHHHTYHDIDGLDYQILVEADFLVNLYEDQESIASVRNVYNKILKTETSKKICAEMFGLEEGKLF
ncbi:MAG: HD domain-containing protein [Lachnospiraceae bacterium]|nr:HD domain-containing protein [Lachnospiraceae bacterium]